MRSVFLLISLLFVVQSCIPLRVAPKIENHKVTKGKKFKRSLSKRQMFIFENPKEEHHFYNYVNTKFQLNDSNVYDDIPFVVDREQYFFAWYEVEIPDKTLNLAPMFTQLFIGAALGSDNPLEDYNGEDDIRRRENWYVAIEVYSDSEKDCLAAGALSREVVLKYLRALKQEYLATHNYNEVVFKN